MYKTDNNKKLSKHLRFAPVIGLLLCMVLLLSAIGCAPAQQATAEAVPASSEAGNEEVIEPTVETAPTASEAGSEEVTQPAEEPAAAPEKKIVTPEDVAGPGPLDGQTIKIGIGAPLTGDQARGGLEIQYSAEWVAEKVNELGGVLGAKVVIVPGDDQHNPKLGESVAQKFVDDPEVMGVLGHFNSAVEIPASVIYEKGSVVTLSTATNPTVTERGLKTVFRLGSRDDYIAKAGAIYIGETLKATKMVAIDDQTTFGKGVVDQLEQILKEKYPQVGLTRTVIKAGDKDYRAVLGSLPKDTEVLYYGGYAPEASLIAKQMPEVGLEKAELMGPDTLFNVEDFVKAAGGAAEGAVTFGLTPPSDTVPESAPFLKDVEQRLGGLSNYAGLNRDAALILLSAIKRAGVLDRQAVRDEVAKTCDFYGISTLEGFCFDETGDNENASIFVYQAKGDGFDLIETISGSSLVK